MALPYILFLAIVQGITEFLPISSSAHLILGRDLMEATGLAVSQGTAADQLAFDIALHVGTLLAVILYFWRDIAEMILGFFDGITGKAGPRFHLLVMVIVATLPIVVVGFLAKDLVTNMLRSTAIIAWMTIIFGIVLWVADRFVPTRSSTSEISYAGAIFIGAMQCLAIVPGVSRSGITMTAGRFLGFDRPLSARFALLLSVPTIAAAGLLIGVDLFQAGDARLTADALIGGALAFVSALVAIALMMRWLRSASYMPFIVYRLALGLLLIVLIYGFGWAPVHPA